MVELLNLSLILELLKMEDKFLLLVNLPVMTVLLLSQPLLVLHFLQESLGDLMLPVLLIKREVLHFMLTHIVLLMIKS